MGKIGHNDHEERLLTLTIGDQAEHDFPDTDGDDTANGPHDDAQEPIDVRHVGEALVKITNDLTVAISGRLEGTTTSDRESFADPISLASFSALGAGESTYLVIPAGEPWPAIRTVVSADSAPAGGNTVTAEWEKKHGRD
jgi:hypothetical protein